LEELVGKDGNWDARNVDPEKVVSPPSIAEVKPVVEAIRRSHKHTLNRVPVHKHKLSKVAKKKPVEVPTVVSEEPPVEAPVVVAEKPSVKVPAVVTKETPLEIPAINTEVIQPPVAFETVIPIVQENPYLTSVGAYTLTKSEIASIKVK
jgi:hypothetical protein